MKYLKPLVLLFSILSLVGCISMTPNFAVKPEFWNDKNKVIGVAIGDMSVPRTHKSGSQGLLDIAINDANASELDQYLATLDISKINDTAKRVAVYLKGKGMRVKLLAKPIVHEGMAEFTEKENNDSAKIYFSSTDYRPLKQKHGIDKLLVVNIVRIGTIRDYYGFIPLTDPSGLSHLAAYIVNLDNNQLEWKQTVVQTVPVAGKEWDTPPKFQGLTEAMYVAFNQSRDLLFTHLTQ